ncbi:type I-F CRISPR-associated endoribonuclease Cas6/Csy4, partial [Vibrio rotiferianus]
KRSELQGSAVTYEEALKGYEGQDISKNTSLPFVKLVSNSTGCPFRLTIKKQYFSQESSGCFNSFGLSTTTTVPDF